MFELVKKNGVAYFVSSLIKSSHAFSTRIGGVSELEHTKSLNLAFGRGDEASIVLRNIVTFGNAVGMDHKKIISVPQIHSSNVRAVDRDDAGAGVFKKADFECDGYVTAEDDLPLGVKTADCVPILLEARDDCGRVIAVSAVHAGWRGTAARIAENAIDELCTLGAKKENIYVAIGACIDECCYEVGVDFANAINEILGQNYATKFIQSRDGRRLFANLKGMNLQILLDCGIPRDHIDISPHCTCCEPELFYSHRAQKGVRGAMMSIICK